MNDSEYIVINPCPFCGGPAKLYACDDSVFINIHKGNEVFSVRCNKCCVSMDSDQISKKATDDERVQLARTIAEEWNRRD